ncbi:outer membrane family protein [Helicobacter sp.]|uniref:outer membrane family protein n=1 Tax=Helicobacter sp. TaxID=218 RepID=UPI0038900E59
MQIVRKITQILCIICAVFLQSIAQEHYNKQEKSPEYVPDFLDSRALESSSGSSSNPQEIWKESWGLLGITSDSFRANSSLLRVQDIDLASFSSVASFESSLFGAPFTTGYSALFTRVALESARFGGFYMGGGFSAIGKIADFARSPITRQNMQEDPRIYSLLINNDEAKDLFYTSDSAHMPAFFLGYALGEGEGGADLARFGVKLGRYEAQYEWIGDYLEGGEIYGNVGGVRLALGGFYRQTYANPAENTHYGYIKNLYERHQGYKINKHFYADANYTRENAHQNLGVRAYANYFASLFAAIGLKTHYEHDFGSWSAGVKAHGTFVSAGVQDSSLCANPEVAESVGLACYEKGSFGKRNGGVVHFEALVGRDVGQGIFRLAFGAVVNDKNHATNLLPIYADNNPLEYNTYIYGEGGRTGYCKLDYRGFRLSSGVELGGFIGYGRTMFFAPDKHFSNQAVGEIELDFTRVKWHLTIAYLDEVRYSKTLVSKLWIGYKF